MSIHTDLTRIKNTKSAIKAAIEGKGVTVPDATLLDGMAALIESIEAGAGGGFVSGTITPASSAIQTITHNLGKQPTGLAIFCSLSASANKKNGVYSAVGDKIGQYYSTYFSKVIEGYYASPISGFNMNCIIAEANDMTFKCALFGSNVSSSFATLLTGVEYRWYVW